MINQESNKEYFYTNSNSLFVTRSHRRLNITSFIKANKAEIEWWEYINSLSLFQRDTVSLPPFTGSVVLRKLCLNISSYLTSVETKFKLLDNVALIEEIARRRGIFDIYTEYKFENQTHKLIFNGVNFSFGKLKIEFACKEGDTNVTHHLTFEKFDDNKHRLVREMINVREQDLIESKL